MRRLPRRLALWGGAAAIASGGFAFMANNVVSATSAGEGANNVSGYTAYTTTYNDVCTGAAPTVVCKVATFTIRLKPMVWNTMAPKHVTVTVFGTAASPNSTVLAKVATIGGHTTTGGTMTVKLQTTSTKSKAYYAVHVAPTTPFLLHTITGLDVAASN